MAILGIDLGTTNSLCAIYQEDKPILIPNAHGEYMTPSAISINAKSELIVGKAALEFASIGKYQSIKSFKRYMGSNKTFSIGKNLYRAEELSAIILKSLKRDAELFLNKEINSAIISVPSYFNNMQRRATRIAAELAGLKVERLVNEPTAAALAYGIASKAGETKYLIFDLGGGTFDVSIIELFSNVLEVRASSGDNFLGGDDFTESLVKDFCKHTCLKTDAMNDGLRYKLWKEAEYCKIKLNESKTDNRAYEMNFNYNEEVYSHSYTLAKIERIFEPLIDRIIQPIKRSLSDSKLNADQLDVVVFAGGSTKMNILAKICAKIFKKFPFTYHDPQHVVVMGVATMCGMYEKNKNLEEFVLTDVSPYTLGVSAVTEDQNGSQLEYVPIIERNTTLPVSKVKYFYADDPDQDKIIVRVYQGESRILSNNIKISEFFVGLNKSIQKRKNIEVRFTYDVNGILEVKVNIPESGLSKTIVIKESCGNMSEEEIAHSLQKLNNIKIHPREQDVNLAIIARAERMYEEYTGEFREKIGEKIKFFYNVLDRQDESLIKEAYSHFSETLDSIEVARE